MSSEGCDSNSYISVGPWGGQNGVRWDDGVFYGVRQVVICYGAAIESIQFEYIDKRGISVWSDKHGGAGGLWTNKVKLAYPDEYLVSVSGYYGNDSPFGSVLIRSLEFESNRRKYGPFGIQYGTQFSFPLNGAKVIGFHGRSSWYLDSIGVYLKPLLYRNPTNNLTNTQQNYPISNKKRDPNNEYYSEAEIISNLQTVVIGEPVNMNPKQAISYGPWGGNGGMIFDDGVYTGVREIHLTRYGGIVSMRVCYDMNGQALWGNKNGGSGGIRLDKIAFDYPSEILTHITGYYGSTILRGPIVVKSLTFHTNKRKYGPFGDEQGISFSSAGCKGNEIVVGFHGRKGWFIDGIGVHSRPLSGSSFHTLNYNIDARTPEVVQGVLAKETAISTLAGAWGGNGGMAWDDGIFSGIKKIFLAKGEAIYCIQIEYDRNGQSSWSVRHGGGSEGSSHMIKFEYPYEILTSISGYHGSLTGDDSNSVIRSLTFHTNKGKYGPFGEEVGTFFTSTKTEGKIIGFHGRSGCYLNAIGVHMQQWSDSALPQVPGERGGAIKMMINKLFN